MKVIRLAHATALLQFGSITVLTDPWLTDRPGWRRSERPGMRPEELPPIDLVLCSHHHPDHFDLKGLRAVCSVDVSLVVRAGTRAAAVKAGYRNVTELDHWGSVRPLPGLTVTATPARHSAPENTYILEAAGRTLFFGGDTRLVPEFHEVAKRFPRIDLALLPVNGVRLFGMQTVMDPAEAVEACRLLSPRVAIPIHYGMAGGWKSGWMLRQPGRPEEFAALLQQSGVKTQAVLLSPGQSYTL